MPTRLILSTLIFFAPLLVAQPTIVTSTTTLADLVRKTVGPNFSVTSIASGPQDPHYVEAKPSYMVRVRKAEAVVAIGLDLEVGWLPMVLRGARNPRILPGNQGYIDVSQFITPIEIATQKVDRSQGDLHGLGNPHYLLNPLKAKKVIEGLSQKFQLMFPKQAEDIKKSTAKTLNEWSKHWKTWSKKLKKGSQFVTHHKTLNDFFAAFELKHIDSIEPKPGIPPSAKHIFQLVKTIKSKKVNCILVESFFEISPALRLQKSTSVGVAVVPVEVFATKKANDYFSLIDSIVEAIEKCVPGKVHRD